MLTKEEKEQIEAIIRSTLYAGDKYVGPERRTRKDMSEEVMEELAERAAERALDHVYTAIGRSVITKALWLVGAALCSLAAWLAGSGHFKG